MRYACELALAVLLLSCERESRAPNEGAAKPLVLGSAPAGPTSSGPPRLSAAGCVLGAHRCVGDKLEACEERGFVQVNVCQTAAHCNGKLRQCLVDPCILGEHQCNGSDLEQCHANGWTRVSQCDSPAACDAERGRCN